jgi:hypothetical protein
MKRKLIAVGVFITAAVVNNSKRYLSTLAGCVVASLLLVPHARAEIDCNARCCKTVRITPFDKNTVCQPSCKASCEITKGVGIDPEIADYLIVPNLVAKVEKELQRSCASAFQIINGVVILHQNAYSAGSSALLEQAKQILIDLNLVNPVEFQNVSIKWAKLAGVGQAPDRNIVLITQNFLTDNNLLNTTLTLLHEMVHIRQYRHMTTDGFKCEYSRAFVGNGGNQDDRHFLEREAYAVEKQHFSLIRDYIATTWPRRRFQGHGNPAMGCGRDERGVPILGAPVSCD